MILSNRDNVRCVEMKMPPVQFSQPSPPLLKVFLFLLLLLKQTPGKMMTLIYFRKNAKAPASSQRPVFNYENLLDQSFSTTPLSLFFFFLTQFFCGDRMNRLCIGSQGTYCLSQIIIYSVTFHKSLNIPRRFFQIQARFLILSVVVRSQCEA